MKEQYRWNYQIRIKTKEGTFEYEKQDLDNIDLLLEKHKDYEEFRAERKEQEKCKKKVLKK